MKKKRKQRIYLSNVHKLEGGSVKTSVMPSRSRQLSSSRSPWMAFGRRLKLLLKRLDSMCETQLDSFRTDNSLNLSIELVLKGSLKIHSVRELQNAREFSESLVKVGHLLEALVALCSLNNSGTQ